MNKPDKIEPPILSVEELDRRFDDGEDVLDHFDVSRARRPNLESRRVNVDFPAWMVRKLDEHARKRGVTRQALIKMWLADRLEATPAGTALRAGWAEDAAAIGPETEEEKEWRGFGNDGDADLRE